MINIEPLKYFYDKFGLVIDEVENIFSGEKYSGILLKNKKIGICANVDASIPNEITYYQKLDFENIHHRIFLNAYYNAKFNNTGNDLGKDLLQVVDFHQYKNIVMIGDFFPIVAKFNKMKINADIFDLKSKSGYLVNMNNQKDYLAKSDAVILTATSISNNTFMNIINWTNENTDIYLLGPSTPMINEMLNYRNIKHLFGTAFPHTESIVQELISNNQGPRKFLKYGQKSMLLK